MERWTLLLVVAVASNGQAVDPPTLTAFNLPESAVATWERYRQFMTRLQGRITYEFTSYDPRVGGGLSVQRRVTKEVRQRPGAAMWREKEVWPEGDERVVLSNRYYSCSLRRRSGTDPWLLEQIVMQSDAKLPEMDGTVSEAVRGMTASHYVLDGQFLPEAIRSGVLRLTRVDPAYLMDGRTFTRFEYENQEARSGKRSWSGQIVGGWVVLDPGAGWCIRERLCHRKYADGLEECRFKFDYSVTSSGYPITRRIQVTCEGRIDKDKSYRFEAIIHPELAESDGPPEPEFTLSAFGLPEPVGVEWERKTPVYVWLILAAGVLGLLALVLRWLAHRRRTTG